MKEESQLDSCTQLRAILLTNTVRLCMSIFGAELGIETWKCGEGVEKTKRIRFKSQRIFVLTLRFQALYVNGSRLPVGSVVVGACNKREREGKGTTSSHAGQRGTASSLNKTRYTSIFPSTLYGHLSLLSLSLSLSCHHASSFFFLFFSFLLVSSF